MCAHNTEICHLIEFVGTLYEEASTLNYKFPINQYKFAPHFSLSICNLNTCILTLDTTCVNRYF